MPLETIYVVRHGFRSSWTVDPITGVYSATVRSPTGIAADPTLTSHGVKQAKELAAHLATLEPPIEAVYSSPYYRCLQTIEPFINLRQEQSPHLPAFTIRPEHGLREFFGSAPFHHPGPASPETLKAMFPAYDETFVSAITPSTKGETFADLYDRVARAVQGIVDQCDRQGVRSVVLCTHAAVVIILGRVLTGQIPNAVEEDDFRAFTCGLSTFSRRGGSTSDEVLSQWTCESNSDCSFLSGGEERGWSFQGDESFPGTGSMSTESTQTKL